MILYKHVYWCDDNTSSKEAEVERGVLGENHLLLKTHLENLNPSFSSSSFVIHLNLNHLRSFLVYHYLSGVFLREFI